MKASIAVGKERDQAMVNKGLEILGEVWMACRIEQRRDDEEEIWRHHPTYASNAIKNKNLGCLDETIV